jgi:hypothetical protein
MPSLRIALVKARYAQKMARVPVPAKLWLANGAAPAHNFLD